MPFTVKEFFLIWGGASTFVAYSFWRGSILSCIWVNLTHSSAEYH